MDKALYSSTALNWQTPEWLCEVVQEFFGHDFLDPAADEANPKSTGATRFWTKTQNGLVQPWDGKVYLNPPYGREIVRWTRKFAGEWRMRRMTEGLMLVPARTDTLWWEELLLSRPLFFFFHGRLKFSGHDNSAPFPSALVYLGSSRHGQELVNRLKEKAWMAHPISYYLPRPGITFEQAREQNPEAFRQSQKRGGMATKVAVKEPPWVQSSFEDFKRYLQKREEE